jgi:hypothetical protein
MSRDPLVLSGSNPYAFAMNDPINRWDPTGFSSADELENKKRDDDPGTGSTTAPPDDGRNEIIYVTGSVPATPAPAELPPPVELIQFVNSNATLVHYRTGVIELVRESKVTEFGAFNIYRNPHTVELTVESSGAATVLHELGCSRRRSSRLRSPRGACGGRARVRILPCSAQSESQAD